MRPAASPGVALVVVLWAVGLISSALLGLSLMFQSQLDQEVAALQNARAMLVAESGIQMCLHREIGPEDVEEASRQLSQRLQNGWRVPVEFRVGMQNFQQEEGRLDLNYWLTDPAREKQAQAILQNLFAGWGVNLDTSVRVIDCLLDWTDPDNFSRAQGAEEEDYRENKMGRPRNGALEDLRELESVLGWREMAEQARQGPQAVDWRSKFTLYGSGKLSLKAADQDLIEAVLGMAPGSAKNFIAVRAGPDGRQGTKDDVVNPGLLSGVRAEVLQERTSVGEADLWRVSSTGKVGEVKRVLVALLSRNPPQVMARWLQEEEEK